LVRALRHQVFEHLFRLLAHHREIAVRVLLPAQDGSRAASNTKAPGATRATTNQKNGSAFVIQDAARAGERDVTAKLPPGLLEG